MTTIIKDEKSDVQKDVLGNTGGGGTPSTGSPSEGVGAERKKRQYRTWALVRSHKYDSSPTNPRYAGISEEDWREEIKNHINRVLKDVGKEIEWLVYIFHDRDVENGVDMPLHAHIMVRFKSVQKHEDVANAFLVSRAQNCQKVNNPCGKSRYLTHISNDAIAQEKTIYLPSDVVCHGIEYKEIIKESYWQVALKKEVSKDKAKSEVEGFPINVYQGVKSADALVKHLAAEIGASVIAGKTRSDDALMELARRAGTQWVHTHGARFEKDALTFARNRVKHLKKYGRKLRNIYIMGAGGIGKSTLANLLAMAITGSDNVSVAAPNGEGKTPDILNHYNNELALIINEMSASGFTLQEFLAVFDMYVYAPVPSRHTNKDFIGELCILTNSITPMMFANDVLVYSKGGTQYQDPANKKRINMNDPKTVDKYWQVRRRMTNIIVLERNKQDATKVRILVFNLRYGKIIDKNGNPSPDDGEHVFVGSVDVTAEPGRAPEYTDEVIAEIKRLVEIDLLNVYRPDEYYIQTYISENGLDDMKVDNAVENFVDEVVSECRWSMLPRDFLHQLYRAYKERYFPMDDTLSKPELMSELVRLMPDWEYKENAVRTGDRMNGDEPLITEYDLRNWMNQNYNGSDLAKKRAFTRKDRYRGFVRK